MQPPTKLGRFCQGFRTQDNVPRMPAGHNRTHYSSQTAAIDADGAPCGRRRSKEGWRRLLPMPHEERKRSSDRLDCSRKSRPARAAIADRAQLPLGRPAECELAGRRGLPEGIVQRQDPLSSGVDKRNLFDHRSTECRYTTAMRLASHPSDRGPTPRWSLQPSSFAPKARRWRRRAGSMRRRKSSIVGATQSNPL
jgi:hypothetical protein